MKMAVTTLLAAGLAAANSSWIPAKKADVLSFFGTSHVKLVFVDRGSLYFVDFSESTPAAIKIAGITEKVIAPDISPDGKWVTYATAGTDNWLRDDICRDSTVKSSAWICRLEPDASPIPVVIDSAHVPRFVKNSGQLDLVYSTKGDEDAWEKGEGKVKRKSISADGVVSDEEEIIFDGFGCYGGLSYDNRYLATGVNRACMVDLEDEEKLPVIVQDLRLRTAESPVYELRNQTTVCNPSISSSRIYTNSMMYFDLGSSGYFSPAINSGNPWKMHQVIFIATYDREITGSFSVPDDIPLATTEQLQENVKSGEYGGMVNHTEWDNPEWSANHPYFSVAAVLASRPYNLGNGWEPTDRNELAYAINIRDSTYLRLLQISDTSFFSEGFLQWPGLWVDTGKGFSEEAGWMEKELDTRKTYPNHEPQQPDAWIADNEIRCASAIRNLSIYKLDGRLISNRRINDKNRRTVPLAGLNLNNGLVIAVVETDNRPKSRLKVICAGTSYRQLLSTRCRD
jgi:hypothetical protein